MSLAVYWRKRPSDTWHLYQRHDDPEMAEYACQCLWALGFEAECRQSDSSESGPTGEKQCN